MREIGEDFIKPEDMEESGRLGYEFYRQAIPRHNRPSRLYRLFKHTSDDAVCLTVPHSLLFSSIFDVLSG